MLGYKEDYDQQLAESHSETEALRILWLNHYVILSQDHCWPQNRTTGWFCYYHLKGVHIRTFFYSYSVFLFMSLSPLSPNLPHLRKKKKKNLRQNSIMPLATISYKGPIKVQHKVNQNLTSFSTKPHCFTPFKFRWDRARSGWYGSRHLLSSKSHHKLR